jgi:hypothetical protein
VRQLTYSCLVLGTSSLLPRFWLYFVNLSYKMQLKTKTSSARSNPLALSNQISNMKGEAELVLFFLDILCTVVEKLGKTSGLIKIFHHVLKRSPGALKRSALKRLAFEIRLLLTNSGTKNIHALFSVWRRYFSN